MSEGAFSQVEGHIICKIKHDKKVSHGDIEIDNNAVSWGKGAAYAKQRKMHDCVWSSNIDHEIFPPGILSLPLVQEGQLFLSSPLNHEV